MSSPFLLCPRAKSNLLHIEARFQMEQTVAHARMEQQLYGGVPRVQMPSDDAGLVLVKRPALPGCSGAGPSASGGSASSSGSGPSHRHSGSGTAAAGASGGTPGSSGSRSSASKRSGASSGGKEQRSLRGLIMGLFRRSRDDVVSFQDQVPPRSRDSFSLPPPAECNMPGTHSDMCILRVRRTRLVEDALSEISRQWRKDLFKPLRVHFIGEEGIDAGGVKKVRGVQGAGMFAALDGAWDGWHGCCCGGP